MTDEQKPPYQEPTYLPARLEALEIAVATIAQTLHDLSEGFRPIATQVLTNAGADAQANATTEEEKAHASAKLEHLRRYLNVKET